MEPEVYKLRTIGFVRRREDGIRAEILEPYRPGLRELARFSHVIVLWWAHKHDNERSRSWLQTEPPYAPGKVMGVYGTRAEYRPNPIGLTVCKLKGVDEEKGFVEIAEIDAYDGTPVVDLKAYFPVCDRVREARIPEWLSDWPEWMPDEGLGLEG
jgi:tRNA-Thr(GGU) m(6)t(6)A37 methyltransferase TsaA